MVPSEIYNADLSLILSHLTPTAFQADEDKNSSLQLGTGRLRH